MSGPLDCLGNFISLESVVSVRCQQSDFKGFSATVVHIDDEGPGRQVAVFFDGNVMHRDLPQYDGENLPTPENYRAHPRVRFFMPHQLRVERVPIKSR